MDENEQEVIILEKKDDKIIIFEENDKGHYVRPSQWKVKIMKLKEFLEKGT